MSKVGSMTFGLVLIFVGIQLYLVKSYLLTPTATRFVNDYFNSNNCSQFANNRPGLLSNGGVVGSGVGGGLASNSQQANRGPFSLSSSNQGQMSRHPGQSWPYYGTNSQNSGGGLFQNSGFRTNPSNTTAFGNPGSTQTLATANQVFADGQLRQRFVPPKWVMWPALFLGSVFFLHGIALRS